MVEEVVKLLKKLGLTIGFVESMTGGAIASAITKIDGSSQVFKGSLVTYSKEIKNSLLGISYDTIDYYGIVSKEVARQMVLSGQKILDVDLCVSVTGDASFDLQEKSSSRKAVICLLRGDIILNYVVEFRDDEDRCQAINKTVDFIYLKLFELFNLD